jgi:uncharacterized protein with ParB-like and HNH nuclease domain
MAFEAPITIKQVIDNIDKKEYLLPAIQREFVWDTEQIERLFDSLMRDYPIGAFLFWHVDRKKTGNYQYYEFIRDFHERDSRHNPKADVTGEEDIIAILDGQQRFTALYVALKGTYTYKLPYKRWDNPDAFPKRKLYLNLLKPASNGDMEYDFQFLTDDEARKPDEAASWFRVGHILDIKKEYEVNDYLIDQGVMNRGKQQAKFANETLFKLHSVIHKDKVISYYQERDERLDKVLNIFIRVNSGGTQLSYSDLLLSIATAQWKNKDARQEITNFVDDINEIGDKFTFDKDFILKSCLVLCDFKDIAFKVDNFNRSNMLEIEKRWDEVSNAIRKGVELVSSFGYNRDTLTANYPIVPIAYYLLKKATPHNFVEAAKYSEDRKLMRQWLILSLIKRVFGGQPDTVLRPVRQIIDQKCSTFPFVDILEHFKGSPKSLLFSDDDIENLFDYQYGQSYTFSVLSLLYPSLDYRNKFHQDHIYPRTAFTPTKLRRRGIPEDKIEQYLLRYNSLANLQLLEGTPNREKSDQDFKGWLQETFSDSSARKSFCERNYIPQDTNLGFDNFLNVLDLRKQLLAKRLKHVLKPHQ